ncbi:MAG: CDP-glycerol glycerophosphotransferase family protein [Bacteroidales bacterium]|nr:CDP-glycerol glycerophosphotransferase family protein [Bacteroidales bacterium]
MNGKDILRALGGLVSLPSWCLQRAVRRRPSLWVFGAWYGNLYSDNSRAMFEYVCDNHPEIDAVWITSSEAVLSEITASGRRALLKGSREGRRTCRRAGIAFVSTAADDVCEKDLNGCKVVMLWHGCPIKIVGNDARRFMVKNTLWKRIKTAIRRIVVPWEFIRYDMVCSLSEFFNPIFCSAFGIRPEVNAITGLPRNDALFEGGDRLTRSLEERWRGCTKIVYLPTFRDTATGEGLAFNPFTGFGFDAERLGEVLERNNMVLIYKGHFYDLQHGASKVNALPERIVCISDRDYDSLYGFLGGTDILITDYSSVFFDYIITGKKVILAPFDYDEYIRVSRPFYFDYSLMEATRAKDWNAICDILSNDGARCAPQGCISRFNAYTDAGSRDRVYREVIKRFCNK